MTDDKKQCKFCKGTKLFIDSEKRLSCKECGSYQDNLVKISIKDAKQLKKVVNDVAEHYGDIRKRNSDKIFLVLTDLTKEDMEEKFLQKLRRLS